MLYHRTKGSGTEGANIVTEGSDEKGGTIIEKAESSVDEKAGSSVVSEKEGISVEERIRDVECSSEPETNGGVLDNERDIITRVIEVSDDASLNPWTWRAFIIGIGLSAFGGVLGSNLFHLCKVDCPYNICSSKAEIYYFKPVSVLLKNVRICSQRFLNSKLWPSLACSLLLSLTSLAFSWSPSSPVTECSSFSTRYVGIKCTQLICH